MLQCVALCEPSHGDYLTCMGGGSVGSSLRKEPFVSRVFFQKRPMLVELFAEISSARGGADS